MKEVKQVVFRAYDTKRQQPVRLSPVEDKSGKLYTGQGKREYLEFLTEAEMKQVTGRVIDRTTIVTISDGKVLDMDDPIDAANWKWIQKHPYVALEKAQGLSSRDAVFYIDNPEKEAEDRVTKDKRVTKAKMLIYDASNVRKISLAKALGNPGAESMKMGRIEDWLAHFAEKSPDSITALLDKDATAKVNAMILFEDLKRYRIITRHAGEYRYGGADGTPIGRSDELVVEYLLDKGNEEQVFLMSNIVKEKAEQ